jgi:hypothetical protein
MLNTQSNTQQGPRPFNSGEALTGKEGYLAVLVDGDSIPELLLPTTVSELALFIIDEGGALDKDSAAIPLVAGEERRIKANGSGSAGAILVLEAPGADPFPNKGKVRTIPATEGVYFSPGIAQEDFVDEQLVNVRVLPRLVHVGTAFSSATPAATAATNSTPYGYSQAQADAILVNLRELRAWAVANGFKATA